MIRLSKPALSEVQRLKSKHQNPQAIFRLGVQPTGCAGMSYTMSFDEAIRPGDQVYNCDDVQVAVDAQSLTYLNGLTLDYSEDLMGGGFRFHNPNAIQNCGCGNSFSVTATE